MIKNAVNKVLSYVQLKIVREEYVDAKYDSHLPYKCAVASLLSTKQTSRIVIVGANDGMINDPVYETIKTFATEETEVLLIEPQKTLNSKIKSNYNFHKNTKVINYAVGQRGKIEVHAIKSKYWTDLQPDYANGWPEYRAPTGVTSSSREHVLKWLDNHFPHLEDKNDVVESFSVESKGLKDIIDECYGTHNVDVLQIDVEGKEKEVIENSSIEYTNPAIVLFESHNISREDRLDIHSLLHDNMYNIFDLGYDDLALRG